MNGLHHRSRARSGFTPRGAILALAAVLVGATFSWGTMCLGEDGHVAFEISVAGQCLDDAREAPSEHATHPSSCLRDAGCGPCTDLSSASGSWFVRANPDLPDPPPVLTSPPYALVTMEFSLPALLVSRGAIPPAAHTATTILRC